jgi:hypothetical protein
VQAGADGYTDPLLLVKPESHGCVTRAYLWSRSCAGSTPVGTRNTQKWIVISPALRACARDINDASSMKVMNKLHVTALVQANARLVMLRDGLVSVLPVCICAVLCSGIVAVSFNDLNTYSTRHLKSYRRTAYT